ncbi:MAG: glycerol-3-phosphate acyltransferase [bacterium]|nr:glycerol-3-phosphate acyltransferase [bacterium]
MSSPGAGPSTASGAAGSPRLWTAAGRLAVLAAALAVLLSAASLLVAQDYLAAEGARVVIVSFALGAIPFSNLLAQSVAATDLRTVGSGTVSGTALYRVAGFAPLAVGGIMDVAKAAPGVFAAGSAPVVSAVAAGAAVAGHNWSPFLRGAGGRGVSPAMGALAVVHWPGAVLLLAGLAVGRAVRQTALVSFGAMAALPFLALWWGGRDAALAGAAVTAAMLLKRLTANNTVPPAGRRARVTLRRLLCDNDGAP